jgi:hypothetical protein
MKIDKKDEQKLKDIFEVLKNSGMNIKGYIDRNDVVGFQISAHKQEETKVAKSEFRRLSKILIDLKLARLKIGNWVNEDELYIIPETLTTNIEEVFKNEAEKEEREDTIAQLNKYNLTYTKYILKTKCLPHLFSFIGLAVSIFAYFKEDCSCIKEQKDQIILTTALHKSQQDSIRNKMQTTSVKSLRDTQP